MNLKDTLLKVGNMITGAMKSLAPTRSGDLRNSIKAEITGDTPDNTVMTISMLKYGQYQDSGVQGSKKAFVNGRVPKPFANKFTGGSGASMFAPGRFKAKYAGKDTGAFDPWRASVAYYGFRPQPFIQPGIDSVLEGEGGQMLLDAGVEEIKVDLDNYLKDVKIKA